jgi:hypothetical protein
VQHERAYLMISGDHRGLQSRWSFIDSASVASLSGTYLKLLKGYGTQSGEKKR